MAIQSIGYPTDVGKTNIDWAIMQQGLGAEYWCNNLTGVQVTPKTDGTRQVHISYGYFGGAGVVDLLTSGGADVTLPTVSSGTRWFMIVARRNFNPNPSDPDNVIGTSFTYIDAGTSNATLPARNNDAQVAGGSGIDDQPLAFVPLTAGQTVPGTPIDLRVLGGSSRGCLLALDERVLQYQNEYGQVIRINDDYWVRRGDGWQKDKGIIASGPGLGNGLGVGGTSGWSTVSVGTQYGRLSRISGFHQVRLQASRSGASLAFSSNGGFTDATVLNISNTSFQPPYRLITQGEYRYNGASFGCTAVMNPDGSVGIISGVGNTEISKRTDGGWSFRCNFEWMSA